MRGGAALGGRIWRVLRRVLRAVLVLLLIVVSLGGATFLFLRSSHGQARLLSWVLPVVQRSLRGPLQVARLRSDLLHSLTLEGIDLADGDGQPAIHLDRLTVRYRLGALRQRTLHITSVELWGGRVQARLAADGQLNLATLTTPSPEPPEASSGRLPITIVVDAITLGSGLSLAGPPGPLHQVAAELTLAAGLRIERDLRIALRIDRLSLPTQTPLKSQLSLAGGVQVVLPPPQSPSHGVAPKAPPEITLADVVLTLRSDGAEIGRVLPQAGLLPGALSAELKLSGALSMLTSVLDISLPKGALHLQASVGVLDERLPWQAALQLQGIELSALRADLPPLRVECALHGRGALASGQLDVERLEVQAGHNTLSLNGKLAAPA
ncbi:MAG TPA: hypothetical protein PKI03_34430, partial [Pseudomonadota bacterium]|nr:hypothetical protein [Pseudomonadota bacterium]